MTLSAMLKKGALRSAATATTATTATHDPYSLPTVANVATVAVATAPPPDLDRCCWPHGVALNGREIETFTTRLARFTTKGLSLPDAEQLADRVVIRDRNNDDRRLCLECNHLQGHGRLRCNNWQQADIPPDGLARDLVVLLQRCAGFRGAL